MNFGSDNTSPVHPDVMAAIVRANQGFADSYGEDDLMDSVRGRVREIFEAPDAAVYLVTTGTAANVLSLACLVQPWDAIYCHDSAHIEIDECGAPEFYTGGAKLVPLSGVNGKLTPELLSAGIKSTPQGDVHSVQRGAVSITNLTESGTFYTPQEVVELSGIAKQFNLPLHMDGARFANALVAQDCSAADLSWKAGVDVLSFGGTKNGLMGVEAVVIFDPEKAWELELRRKRGGHLASKHRFLSAQMLAYLTDDLWLNCARAANAAGAKLNQKIKNAKGTEMVFPAQANMIFAGWTRAVHKRADAAGAAYHLQPMDQTLDGPIDDTIFARLVCSWNTTDAEIDQFIKLIQPD